MQFRTLVRLEGKTATGLEVPPAVVEALGAGKRAKVVVTINGLLIHHVGDTRVMIEVI